MRLDDGFGSTYHIIENMPSMKLENSGSIADL